ncbi:mevalonate kinase [Aureobasidium sp. EXF-8845]|nr:mevalonate kinase [Aureobasidium sp. EXF-8845]
MTVSNGSSEDRNGAKPSVTMANGHPSTHSSSSDEDSHTSDPRPAYKRKMSTPLAPPFMVSAPGKVIVYGEHAVVHGKAAMAAAISLRSYMLVTTLSKSRRTITLRFRDIDLDHTWDIDSLPWDAFSHPDRKKRYYDLVTQLDPALVEAMKPHILNVSPHIPLQEQKIHQAAASSFLYLFLSLGNKSSPATIYTLRSTIPIGAGLGSSASISVCIATSLLIQARALSGPHPDQMPEEAEKQIERINQWSFVGEMLIHGNPSGVDNTVASGGKAVLFKRADYAKPPLVLPLRNFPELPLLLVDTKQAKSTAVEVAKVARLKKTQPKIANHILDAIDNVTESAHALITSPDFDPKDPSALTQLGELVSINHGLLVSLGVSHPKLERLRELVDTAGAGWTKLTGAGGGGCAFTLLKPDLPRVGEEMPVAETVNSQAEVLARLEIELKKEGFEKYETTLGGDGVGVLWPAVLDNGSDELGGEEIDQAKFEAVEGREGVEKLVGVTGGVHGGSRAGWKFWRI